MTNAYRSTGPAVHALMAIIGTMPHLVLERPAVLERPDGVENLLLAKPKCSDMCRQHSTCSHYLWGGSGMCSVCMCFLRTYAWDTVHTLQSQLVIGSQ